MNSKKISQIVFIILAAAAALAGISYGSSLLFLKLHHLDLSIARPWTIWQYWAVYKSAPDKFVKLSVNGCAFGPYVLALGAAAVALFSKKQRALHGDARFATLAEVRAAGLIDPKDGYDRTILVGRFKNHYLTYGGYQFVMLAAPTRSGKGVGVVIPNCLNYSDSLVVLDIKLENFDITSGFRAAHGQDVYLFCPFDEHGRTHRYNPLEYISDDPAARIGNIDAIGTALYSGGNESDKFWSENAKALFRGLCLMVLEHPRLPKTLGEILRQASGKGKPFAEHIQDMFKEAETEGRSYSSACVDALNRITNNSENTLAGIVSTFNGPLLIFQNPRVDLATSANDFDLREVRRKKMTIYLGVTPDKLKDAAVIVNLFFDQLLNLNTRVLPQQDKSLKYQCLLILDEFTAIGKVAMIQQSISYQAGYNMRILTIIQNKSQLEDKYGKAGALTLMANHALMVMYAPSPVVQSDANEYSEMLGYQTVKSKSKSKSFAGGRSGSRSESENLQRRALMLPQEIKELGRWREIVSLENCKPILCDKIKYFEDPAFTKRTNWPVPKIPVQDVDTFVAKLADKRRDASDQDLKDEHFVDKIVGTDVLPKLPTNINNMSKEEKEAACAKAAGQIFKALARPPVDLQQYKLNAEQTQAAVQALADGADDDDDEEVEFETEEQPAAEAEQEKQETLAALSNFSFGAIDDENTDTKEDSENEHELHQEDAEDHSDDLNNPGADAVAAADTDDLSARPAAAASEADALEDEAAASAVETEADTKTKEAIPPAEEPEQQPGSSAALNSEEQLPLNDEQQQTLAALGLDFDDDEETADSRELSEEQRSTLAALGLADDDDDDQDGRAAIEEQKP